VAPEATSRATCFEPIASRYTANARTEMFTPGL
jgi:hypothetical protein